MDSQRCRLILSAGLPRSGSTWAFNVMVECLRQSVDANVIQTVYADDVLDEVVDIAGNSEILVLKCHMPSASLRLLHQTYCAPCVATIRSPHDCVLSLVEKFHFSFHDAIVAVRKACFCVAALISTGNCLVLRYEDGFTNNSDTVRKVARLLGKTLADDVVDEIMRRFSALEITERLDTLVREGVFKGANSLAEIEPGTQWHFNHFGDGKVGGSLSRLNQSQLVAVDHALREVLPVLGYGPAAVSYELPVGGELTFGENGTGAAYIIHGFDLVETWGVWTITPTAQILVRLRTPFELEVTLNLTCRMSPAFTTASGAKACIIINGRKLLTIDAFAGMGEYLQFAILAEIQDLEHPTIDIQIECIGVKSPDELGLGPDTRQLGIGLIRCRVFPKETAQILG